jgi:uroporphyrinogen-III synthase
LEVRHVVPRDGLPSEWPDWVVFVSANAVRGLEAAGLPAGARSRVRAAAVGARTALEAAGHGWNVELVPKRENAEGLLEIMSRVDVRGKHVWIPGGNREGSARHSLPDALRARGAEVVTLGVYETLDRGLSADERAKLNAAVPGVVVFHSPSAVDAVFAENAPEEVRRWQSADLVAVGPATASQCRRERSERVWECSEPSDTALLALLASVGKRTPQEKRA